MENMDIDEDDDPVETEIDVYLSKQLAQNLYLLQYPVRPAHMTLEHAEYLSAKVKPKQSKFEVQMALNTHNHNYDRSKGEQIAINVDGPNPGVNSFYNSSKMDKQVMTSQPSGVSTKRYAAGYLKDGELHLTPVQSIVHMRPSFGYLDKADNAKKADEADSQDEEEPEAKAVTVKFARRETDEAKARRLASYEYMSKKAEEELWVTLNHYSTHDSISQSERNLLFANNTNDENEFHIEQDLYLEKLIPKMESKETEKPALPSNVLSMTELKRMSVGEQVKALMTNAKVMGFNQLLSFMPKGTDPVAVLRSLQQVALLVQGNWVVKSEVLYPKDSMSAHSGAPADTLCRGRDYIIWRFTHSPIIIRKDITSVIKLHAEDVKDILEQVSRLKVRSGWEFLLPYDFEFVSRHPEVFTRQNMIWEAKFKQLSQQLKMPPSDHKLAEKAAAMTTPPRRRRTVSRSSRTKSGDRSMSDMSDGDDVTAGSRARRASGGRGGSGSRERKRNTSGSSDRKRHASGNSDKSRKGSGDRRRRTSGMSDQGANEMETNLDHVAGQEGENISSNVTENGPNSVASNANNSDKTSEMSSVDLNAQILRELNVFLRSKLMQYSVLRMTDVKSLLKIDLTTLPPGHVLGKGVTDRHIEEAMGTSGGIRMLSAQIKCKEAVFAIAGKGDHLDTIRTTLVDIMQKQTMITKIQILKQAVEKSIGSVENSTGGGDIPTFTDADYKKVLLEYCVRPNIKSSKYFLKGTLSADET